MCYSILVEQSLEQIEERYQAKIDRVGFNEFLNNTKVDPKRYKPLAENPRIYPNYWAPIIVMKNEERTITPMRYRLNLLFEGAGDRPYGDTWVESSCGKTQRGAQQQHACFAKSVGSRLCGLTRTEQLSTVCVIFL